MNASIIPALAALIGAAIGGLTSLLASWYSQRIQARAQWVIQDKSRREELYKDFIQDATICYADALQHDKPNVSVLIGLYAEIGRMRLLSSPRVVASAEEIGRKINKAYLKPNKTFGELQDMVERNELDILSDFSEACRKEFEALRHEQF
jgi:hypothetical protein